ncbi:hypothetical protein P152DRAFT_343274 [Eremomyces bilateralis CBS 781.70]|uniref:Uncharacterized protein n=1 Tax=Eremomyces bilateralis CBS 781.70 TaxID=1392243 RepID=A0A6G1G3F0_9PEZI|nr:uncharacterized protein P152DRAFT_343274 [Eremomyces bilateralis CBS 781.70]KAF1812584.1 hypothetical protein P152DRAFT_343274 [Eremomyces bilateralis CBS 781.70]
MCGQIWIKHEYCQCEQNSYGRCSGASRHIMNSSTNPCPHFGTGRFLVKNFCPEHRTYSSADISPPRELFRPVWVGPPPPPWVWDWYHDRLAGYGRCASHAIGRTGGWLAGCGLTLMTAAARMEVNSRLLNTFQGERTSRSNRRFNPRPNCKLGNRRESELRDRGLGFAGSSKHFLKCNTWKDFDRTMAGLDKQGGWSTRRDSEGLFGVLKKVGRKRRRDEDLLY